MKKTILFLFSLTLALGSSSALEYASLKDLDRKLDVIITKKNRNIEIDKVTINSLVRTLKDATQPGPVRERIAWAIGQMELRSEVNALVEASQDPNLLIRSAALEALARMRARSGLETFTEIAKADRVFNLRQRATVALGLLRWEKAIDSLVDLSSDSSIEIRGASVLGMAATHSKKNNFRQLLEQDMSRDPSPYVRSRVQLALQVINRQHNKVTRHLKSPDPDIRLFGALFFHYHGREIDIAVLENALDEEANETVRYELARAIIGIEKKLAKERAREEKRRQSLLKQKAKQRPLNTP